MLLHKIHDLVIYRLCSLICMCGAEEQMVNGGILPLETSRCFPAASYKFPHKHLSGKPLFIIAAFQIFLVSLIAIEKGKPNGFLFIVGKSFPCLGGCLFQCIARMKGHSRLDTECCISVYKDTVLCSPRFPCRMPVYGCTAVIFDCIPVGVTGNFKGDRSRIPSGSGYIRCR